MVKAVACNHNSFDITISKSIASVYAASTHHSVFYRSQQTKYRRSAATIARTSTKVSGSDITITSTLIKHAISRNPTVSAARTLYSTYNRSHRNGCRRSSALNITHCYGTCCKLLIFCILSITSKRMSTINSRHS